MESLLTSGGFVCLFGGHLEGGFKFETGESDSLLALCWKRSPPREPGSAGYLLDLFVDFLRLATDADDLNGAVAGCLKTRSTLSAGRRFIEDAEMGACPRQIFGHMHEVLNVVLKNN